MRYFQNDIYSNPGDPIKVIYAPVVKDDGTIELKEAGKENFDDYIASFRNECDIEYLIKRFTAGDYSVFNQRVANYGDFSKMPKTYAEALQLQMEADNLFDVLPLEMKEQFDNDRGKFFAMAGTEEWLKIIRPDLFQPKPEDIKPEVIKTEDSKEGKE